MKDHAAELFSDLADRVERHIKHLSEIQADFEKDSEMMARVFTANQGTWTPVELVAKSAKTRLQPGRIYVIRYTGCSKQDAAPFAAEWTQSGWRTLSAMFSPEGVAARHVPHSGIDVLI